MLSKSAVALLEKLLSILSEGRYQVLEDTEILEGIDDISVNVLSLPKYIDELVDDGAVLFKFKNENDYCLAITERAKKSLERAKRQEDVILEAPAVDRLKQTIKTELAGTIVASGQQPEAEAKPVKRVKKPAGFFKMFFASLFGSLFGGGAVAAIYYCIVNLVL